MNGVGGAGQQELDKVAKQVRIFVWPIAVGDCGQRMRLEGGEDLTVVPSRACTARSQLADQRTDNDLILRSESDNP